ncbi:NACHT domain-containing protein [Streptomyces alanosinicus]|uniref:NACHT domain-containing protein n=1 Tax=Streptomyces alanosinicus TaxID=68171 RepID=A0A918YPE6_9ACTN|nr:NACHT domain-containing protein [Streptomyces alanosinicus]GHE10963.1 hypothetical protein GCM10010339_68870 [Streptomyces alanosinicus]
MFQFILPPDLVSTSAAGLARAVHKRESCQRRLLLGREVQRINLSYRLVERIGAEEAAAYGRLFGKHAGLTGIADYYRTTDSGRLVITGGPGAGKTLMALELLIELINRRREDEPVPVRFSLAAWDTSVKLDEYLVAELVRSYGRSRSEAEKLVARQMVLPVMDGLDELDPVHPDGTPASQAPRAQAVLAALNDYLARDGLKLGPVILTCRTEHYQAMYIPESKGNGQLLDSVQIDIEPVPAVDAHAYLVSYARGDARWTPLLDALQRHPEGLLARTLSTPWRLCLTVTAYAIKGDPAELLRYSSAQHLDGHLLRRYIPEATALRPSRRYGSHRVHRYLHHLAEHLKDHSPSGPTLPFLDRPGEYGRPQSAGSDIILHELWPLAGRDRVRRLDRRLSQAVFLVCIPLLFASGSVSMSLLLCSQAWAAWATAGTFMVDKPRRIRWKEIRSQRTHPLRPLLLGFALTQLFALAVGLVLSLHNVELGIGTALVLGPASLAYPLFDVRFAVGGAKAMRPRTVISGDLMFTLARIITIGLPMGTLGWFVQGPSLGLASGLVWALAMSVGASRRYLAFVLCSRRDRTLPLRLGRFLDWACDAGLMRLSGSAYQFRHRELQFWLAQHPDPLPTGK